MSNFCSRNCHVANFLEVLSDVSNHFIALCCLRLMCNVAA